MRSACFGDGALGLQCAGSSDGNGGGVRVVIGTHHGTYHGTYDRAYHGAYHRSYYRTHHTHNYRNTVILYLSQTASTLCGCGLETTCS